MRLPTLSATDVACRRGSRVLFSGFDLALRSAEVVWLRGPNGRGKTSLLRLLAGLAPPDAGCIRWDGRALRDAPDYAALRVYVGHAQALKDDLSALEALQFLAALHGRASESASILSALHRLGAAAHSRAPLRTLSQGQRRRVALARLALETRAGPWLLDEPYDALDPEGTAAVNALLREHVARGGSVLLTSHQPVAIDDVALRQVELEAAA